MHAREALAGLTNAKCCCWKTEVKIDYYAYYCMCGVLSHELKRYRNSWYCQATGLLVH
jgi:hypothetical protein